MEEGVSQGAVEFSGDGLVDWEILDERGLE
jgi:hypothetical protein